MATETWEENGGGEAEIRPFPGGVLVDAAGMLRLKETADADQLKRLPHGGARRHQPPLTQVGNARGASKLRYISLPRLEREIARRQAAHEKLDPTMLTLAGLRVCDTCSCIRSRAIWCSLVRQVIGSWKMVASCRR